MKTIGNCTSRSRQVAWFAAWLLILSCGGLACFQAAAATTFYSNDFEAYTGAAASLDDAADADPAGNEWNVSDDAAVSPNTAGAGIQLINWQAHGGSQALLCRNGTLADIYLFDARSGSRYQLDFWMYVHKAPGNRGFRITLRGEGSDHNGEDYLAYGSVQSTAATIRYYDGVAGTGAWKTTTATHTDDTWQHHRIVIDPATLQMTVFIDNMDTPVIENADLARCEIAVPTVLRLQHEGDSADDGYFIIDDIQLAVDGAIDLTTTFTEGFEGYAARADEADDADPAGPWITTETDGTGTGRMLAPNKVQVVGRDVVAPHSGNQCLKLQYGQRAGATIAWGVPPQSDVEITWWAQVPSSVDGQTANYLRMSLYGAENYNTLSGDNALLGYGSREATIGDETSLTYYITAWLDSQVDYLPSTWEQYRLTTHTSAGRYSIVKNPSSATPEIIVDRGPFIGTATNWAPVIMAAWSSSNGTNHPPVYIDDIEIKSLVSTAEPLSKPYDVSFASSHFTNVTVLELPGVPVGKPTVDPRDNTTILFAVDATAGGIYRADKVASGTWQVDTKPIVTGLDRPSGLAIQTNGTLWWCHDYNNDYTRSVGRLQAPWESNAIETVIAELNDPVLTDRDDDSIDLIIAPMNFTGTIGQPGMIVVADRGLDGDANNAIYVIDPSTTELGHTNYSNFLAGPTPTALGSGDLNSIAALPQSGEVVTLSAEGTIVATDANGFSRFIYPSTLWPLGATASGAAVTADPTTGRLWLADDLLDEIWSVDPSGLTPDVKELAFPPTNLKRPERVMDFHESSLAFSPDGKFLVVTDTSTVNDGGRILIFHNEASALPPFKLSSVVKTEQSLDLAWEAAGTAKYRVFRSVDLGAPGSFVDISGELTTPSFTDTNAPAGMAYYRVQAYH